MSENSLVEREVDVSLLLFLVQSFIVTDLFDPRARGELHPSIISRDFHFHNQILHYTLDLYKGLFHKSISTHLSKYYFSTQNLF